MKYAWPVRTSVRLVQEPITNAKEQCARTGETLTQMIQRGLRLVLAEPRRKSGKKIIRIPTSSAAGGLCPGVCLDDSAALLDLTENRE